MMNTVKLWNGVEMPQIGYGVYQVTPDECERCVSDALEVGYRMIDTAQAYANEEGVGRAWKNSGIQRKDIFLVTKVWISNFGYDKARASSLTITTERLRRCSWVGDKRSFCLASILRPSGQFTAASASILTYSISERSNTRLTDVAPFANAVHQCPL